MEKKDEKMSRKLFQYDGSFYTYTGKIFDLFAVSVFWILGCLPIITIGASFSALYAAVSKSICNDDGNVGSEFWKAYKRDLKNSVKLWIVFFISIFLILLNIGIVFHTSTNLVALFLMMLYGACFIILIVAAAYMFPAFSKFDMSTGWFVKVAFYCTFRHFPTSIFLFVVEVLCYLLILWHPSLVIIVPGVGCLVAHWMLLPILQEHMPKQ